MRNGNAKQDKMESFFLAETLKYLFLLYSPGSSTSQTYTELHLVVIRYLLRVAAVAIDDALPLSGPHAKVFNTECHPLGAWDIVN